MVVFTDPCANIPQSQVGRPCPSLLCSVRDLMFAGKGRQQSIFEQCVAIVAVCGLLLRFPPAGRSFCKIDAPWWVFVSRRSLADIWKNGYFA